MRLKRISDAAYRSMRAWIAGCATSSHVSCTGSPCRVSVCLGETGREGEGEGEGESLRW
jgi:hypothetical protein